MRISDVESQIPRVRARREAVVSEGEGGGESPSGGGAKSAPEEKATPIELNIQPNTSKFIQIPRLTENASISVGNWVDLVKRIFRADSSSEDVKKARLLGSLNEPHFSEMKKLIDVLEKDHPEAKVESLLDRFAKTVSQNTLESNMSLFQARRQWPNETPLTFSLELKRLCNESFPNLPQETADRLILHKFLEGLNEPLRSKVQLSVPTDLQTAVNNSLKLDKPSLKIANIEGATKNQNPPPMRSRDLKPPLYRSGQPNNRLIRPRFRQNERLNERETRPLIQPYPRPYPKTPEPSRGPRMLPRSREGPNQGSVRPKGEIKCFNCEGNHYVRDCPKPKNG